MGKLFHWQLFLESGESRHISNARQVCSGGMQGRICILTCTLYSFIYLHFHWPGQINCLRNCSDWPTWTIQDALRGKETYGSSRSEHMNPPPCKSWFLARDLHQLKSSKQTTERWLSLSPNTAADPAQARTDSSNLLRVACWPVTVFQSHRWQVKVERLSTLQPSASHSRLKESLASVLRHFFSHLGHFYLNL